MYYCGKLQATENSCYSLHVLKTDNRDLPLHAASPASF